MKPEPKQIGVMTISYAGSSRDGRTNAWRVTCACGHTFSPPTTRLAQDYIECEKCEAAESVNYNDILCGI